MHTSAVRVFDTCCRKCGICQGAGDHDAGCSGGQTAAPPVGQRGSREAVRSEVGALITADLALELRRRAQACEAAGDTEGAKALWADSLQGLEAARAKAPPGGPAAELLSRVLQALSASDQGSSEDMETNARFEDEVDAELENLVAELDAAVAESRAALVPLASPGSAITRLCKFGCQRPVCAGLMKDGRPYVTCCRSCAVSNGGGAHDATCQGAPAQVPETRELALAGAVEVYDEEAGGAKPDRGDSEEARAALRELGLDDEWPSSLTVREVRRRFMREALLCHPDKGPEDEKAWRTERFQRLSAAYSVLELHLAMCDEEAPLPPSGAGAPSTGRGSAPVVGGAAIRDARGIEVGMPEESGGSSSAGGAASMPPPLASQVVLSALPPAAGDNVSASDGALVLAKADVPVPVVSRQPPSQSWLSRLRGDAPKCVDSTEEIRVGPAAPPPRASSSGDKRWSRWSLDLF